MCRDTDHTEAGLSIEIRQLAEMDPIDVRHMT